MAMRLAFDEWSVDPHARRLYRNNESTPVSDRWIGVLLRLVASPGEIVSKEELIAAGWPEVAVADNSLEQAISGLRRLLGAACIETVSRRGYRFAAAVESRAVRDTDEALEQLLAPHRAFVDGRAALESFDAPEVIRAMQVFDAALRRVPDAASAHLGMANACLLRFEMTRADPQPDLEARARAARHAREACRLDAGSAEAWATLGVVLDREGDRAGALAAVDRAEALDPSSWRHHFRRASIDWGEGRLRAAQRVLALVPGFPLAHWMAATVHVARQAFEPALADLSAGLDSAGGGGDAGLGSVALAWLRGLIHLAREDDERALADFARELSATRATHLYARETRANTHYAIGALHLRRGRSEEAAAAFEQTLALVPGHPGALAAVGREPAGSPADRAIGQAVGLAMRGQASASAAVVLALLDAAPPGNAVWFAPVEPMLRASADAAAWAPVLARVRQRAS